MSSPVSTAIVWNREDPSGVSSFFFLLVSIIMLFSSGTSLFCQASGADELPERPVRAGGELASLGAGFSAGLVLGQPLALAGKYTWRGNLALEGAAGYSLLGSPGGFTIDSALLYHLEGARLANGNYLRPFIGIGGVIFLLQEPELALKLPVGMVFYFYQLPLEISLAGAMGMRIFPQVRSYAAGGITLRYRFSSPAVSGDEVSGEEREEAESR